MRGECFALRAVLPAGDVVETGAVPRASVGPDLTRLFVGATGRFGIITKVALRLARRPPYGAELRYRLPDVASALGVARGALRAGVAPWAGRVGVGDEGPELAFRLGAASEAGLAAWAAVLSAGAEAAGGRRLPVTSGGAEVGSFVAGLEVEAGWSRVLAVFEAVARDAKATPWVDFMTPEGATVVFEARDGGARETALRAAEAAGGRVVRAPRPRGAAGATAPGPFAAAESALAAALDPPG
jgi:FAD/FMN-containing dehydrogenase